MNSPCPAISVIVPVYNVEKYLRRCIESILNQKFTDFELLLIDDGSTDSSGDLCDEYARKDQRIIVFHTENRGVSHARQIGISQARGIYSIHVDADDWIEQDMLSEMYHTIQTDNADMLIVDFYLNFSDKQQLICQKPASLVPHAIIADILKGNLMGSLCNKLIRHTAYKEFNISFSIGINYCEDFLVVTEILLKTKKISYLPKPFYHYNQNNTSITNTLEKRTFEQRFLFIHKIESLLSSYPKLKKKINYAKLDIVYCMLFKSHNLYTKKECSDIYPESRKSIFSSRYTLGTRCILFALLYKWDGLFNILIKIQKSRHVKNVK
ncbi:MAG: glycosyltransferase [Bacteroidales bacterium]|jgi:glycosyltransferase involved in cell wall biosynthesis|nr:glycosyltransferase [Bacteroidales bacterium]